MKRRLMIMGTFVALALCGCGPDSRQKLDYVTFDQRFGQGWREVADAGRYAPAARLIEQYLRTNGDHLAAWQKRNLHFHAGQAYACAGDYPVAIGHMQQSWMNDEPPDSPIRWNAYVDATIAFLRKDRVTLQARRDEIAAGPPRDGEVPNLAVVQRLLDNLDQPYSKAYSRNEGH